MPSSSDIENDNQEKDFEKIKHEFKLDESKSQYEVNEVTTNRLRSLEDILDTMGMGAKMKKLIKSGSSKPNLTVYKIKFIQEAIKNKHRLREIGEFLNTSQSEVSNILAYYKIEGTQNFNI